MKLFTIEEILSKDLIDGGEVRTVYNLPDGEVEGVALNNLLASRTRLAADLQGNRLTAYFLLPSSFWSACLAELKHYGMTEDSLDVDSHGAVKDIISGCRFYHLPTLNHVIVYTPHNDVAWRLQVTENHHLITREQAFSILGPNKGFDLIFPYHFALGFAPPRLLLDWAAEGYESAAKALVDLAALPTTDKLKQLAGWERVGYTDSRGIMLERGLATPEELLELEGPSRLLIEDGSVVEGEFTVVKGVKDD